MGVPLSTIWTQYFPSAATLTEKHLPSQKGKVFTVTGGNSGVGFELCKILYHAGGKVYLTARSEKLAQAAIEQIRSIGGGDGGGELHFLHLDVADLDAVKKTAQAFKWKESKLHILWNNAGASLLPAESTSKQGHELTTATNCLGAFLLTQLLLPELEAAAEEAKKDNEVRVIWTSSISTEMNSPKHGVDMRTIDAPAKSSEATRQYSTTKAGNYYLASQFAERYTERTGVISLTQNPGNLKTNVWRNVDWLTYGLVSWTLYTQHYGALTVLWAGLSPEVKKEDSGRYVIPWGRWHPGQRKDIVEALKSKDEGGSGRAEEFWEWCSEQCKAYM